MKRGNNDNDGIHACLDLGSNSFHLLIARRMNGELQLLERCSERVQLGEGLSLAGRLAPAAFERGLACLRNFRRLMRKYPIVACAAVGTNALRVAVNADEFLREAAALGFDVRVISGLEEAELIHAGVMSQLRGAAAATRLVVDIGGGSTEIVTERQEAGISAWSLPIGCVAWRDLYFPVSADGRAAFARRELDERLAEALAAAREVFAAVPSLRDCRWEQGWASSGTAKMLRNICRQHGLGQGEIGLRAMQELRGMLLDWGMKPGRDLPGLKEKRRELLLPGWSIMLAVMQEARVDELRFSPAALREGLLLRLMDEHGA